MAERHPMAGKYFALELEGNNSHVGSLVICRVNKTKLHKVFDPEEVVEVPEGMTSVDDVALDVLRQAGAREIYTPSDGCFTRDKVLGFKLYWEKSRKESSPWKYHKPLTDLHWERFFENAGIELKVCNNY